VGDFSAADLRFLLAHSEVLRLSAGEYVFREGEPGEHVYLIRRGRVEILSELATVRRIALRGRGELIGEMALLDTGVRSASARALEDVVLRCLGRETFEGFLDDHPRLGRRLSQLLSQRIRHFQHEVIEEFGEQPRVGHYFGSYMLLEELGRGGMGGVFRARHGERLVALKVMIGDSPELRARFLREGELLQRLDHPNIVRVLERDQVRQTPFLALELVEGEALSARLRRGPLSLAEMADWFAPVASALGYAHRRGVVHRDVKPANLLRRHDGHVKLVDFGVAVDEEGLRLTQTGQHVGTPNYFAPERAQPLAPELEKFSDQYSLGVSVFEAMTGTLPFRGDDPVALLMRHVRDVPPVPSSLRPELPPEVDALILRLLAKDPLRRFCDMETVARELARFGAGTYAAEDDAMGQTMGFE
jgi:serine/threonine protein kinase